MQALILAGGKGARLRPYTTVLPKPLMPIGDLPILEIILRQLQSAGFESVVLAVGYMSHLFESFFSDGKKYGLKIQYSFEDEPLGTAGPIALAIDKLEDNFLVMNGDLLTNIDYSRLMSEHIQARVAATIASHRREVKIDYGVIQKSAAGRLLGYDEKPSFEYDVSMGINVFQRRAVSEIIQPGKYLDIPDLMLELKNTGYAVNCSNQDCDWLDIGRLDDYQVASELFEQRRADFLPQT